VADMAAARKTEKYSRLISSSHLLEPIAVKNLVALSSSTLKVLSIWVAELTINLEMPDI